MYVYVSIYIYLKKEVILKILLYEKTEKYLQNKSDVLLMR